MTGTYNKLFCLLAGKKTLNTQLVKQAGITLDINTKLKENEYESMLIIKKVFLVLNYIIADVLKFLADDKEAYNVR